MTAEAEIQNKIRVAVSKDGKTIFRANVGRVRTEYGRWFETGLPNGFPDLFGFDENGMMFFIEVKNETGKPRPDQITFHKMLMRKNIVHGIARSPEQALKIINNHEVGTGFK